MNSDEYSKLQDGEGNTYASVIAQPSQSAIEWARRDDTGEMVGHFRDPNRYLDITRHAYFNTGILPANGQNIYATYHRSVYSSNEDLFGSRTSTTAAQNGFVYEYLSATSQERMIINTSGISFSEPDVVKNAIALEKQPNGAYTLTRNGALVGSYTITSVFNNPYPIYLCGRNNVGTRQSFYVGKIYNFKINNVDGTPAIDLYPVESGEAIEGQVAPSDCFYDFVSKSFFENQGLGTVTFGRDGWTKVSGNSIDIPDGSAVKSLTLNGLTTQQGIGNPSPTNIRLLNYSRLKMITLTGDENWTFDTDTSSSTRCYFSVSDRIAGGRTFCSHFKYEGTVSSNVDLSVYDYAGTALSFSYIARMTSMADWKAYIAEQAAAGTPIQVYYSIIPSIVTITTITYGVLAQAGTGDPSPTNIRPITPIAQNANLYGQNGVSDNFNLNGTIVRRLSYIAFSGNEAWVKDVNFGYYVPLPSQYGVALAGGNQICSHYIYSPQNNSNIFRVGESIGGSNTAVLRVFDSRDLSLADFKAWLAAQAANLTPVKVVYQPSAQTIERTTPIDIHGISGCTLIGSGNMEAWVQ